MDSSIFQEGWRLLRLTWKPILLLFGTLFLVEQCVGSWQYALMVREMTNSGTHYQTIAGVLAAIRMATQPLIMYAVVLIMTSPYSEAALNPKALLRGGFSSWGRVALSQVLVSLPFVLPLWLLPFLKVPYRVVTIPTIVLTTLVGYSSLIATMIVVKDRLPIGAAVARTYALVPIDALLRVYLPVLLLDVIWSRGVAFGVSVVVRSLFSPDGYPVNLAYRVVRSFAAGLLRLPISVYVDLCIVAVWSRYRARIASRTPRSVVS